MDSKKEENSLYDQNQNYQIQGQVMGGVQAPEQAKRKRVVIVACVAAVVVLMLIIALVVVSNIGMTDSRFVSDNTKYVLTLAADEIPMEEGAPRPVRGYAIYYHDGNKITDLEFYYEFAGASEAAEALAKYRADNTEFQTFATDGKYLVLTAYESDYGHLSPEEIRDYVEFQNSIETVETGSGASSAEFDDIEEGEPGEGIEV